MSNNKKKSGSVYYDKKDKKWKCTYYITDTETNIEKRKYKSFYTEKEAKDFYSTIQYQKGNKFYAENNGLPLNLLIRSNIEKKKESNSIRPRQYARLMQTVKLIEKSPMVFRNIDDIDDNDIQNYLNSLKENYSNSTIKKVMELFTQTYKIAMNKGYIKSNPLIDVMKPKSLKEDKIIRPLTLKEQQKLTNYLMRVPIEEEPYKLAYLLEMFVGPRIGEGLALYSTDIDLEENIIRIDRTLTRNENDKLVMGDTTKTYAGKREVPIPEFIRDLIIYQMKLAENHKDKLLFVDKNGNYVNPINANRDLQAIGKRLGIHDISTHSLRHTYATRCAEADLKPVVVQRLMGHTDIDTTLKIYTKIFNSHKKEELKKVDKYYMNKEIVNKNKEVEEDTFISEKRKRLMEIIKMVEQSAIKGLIPLSEYEENMEYLKKMEQRLDEEEEKEKEKEFI